MARSAGIVRDRLPYLGWVVLVLAVDRVSKILVQRTLDPGSGHVVVPGLFDLVHVHNTGVAFGVLAGGDHSATRVVLLSGVALAAIVVVILYSVRSPASDRLLQTGLALILGGALGNLTDRVSLGYVVDFLYFHAGAYYWPAFNAADTAITLGVAALAFVMIQDETQGRS
jgi:signal peptidase II